MRANRLLGALASAFALSLMTGCETLPESETTTPDASVAPVALPSLQGEHALPVSRESWLTLGPDHSAQLAGQALKVANGQPLLAEFLDSRQQGNHVFVLTLDEHNRLNLINADLASQDTVIATSSPVAMPLEGLCLYMPAPVDLKAPGLQAFLLDESGTGHQMLLRMAGDTLEVTPIREFPLPPGSESCAVDDATAQLFVNEPDVGVWSYPARAETELVRRPMALVQPWGQLPDSPGALQVVGGELLIADDESHHLYRLAVDAVHGAGLRTLDLPATFAIKTLTARVDGSQIHIGLLDDATEALYSLSLPDARPAVTDQAIIEIAASAETTPVAKDGDAADDPAIWINKRVLWNSRVLGTNKKAGLNVYNLHGELLQFIPAGRVNNVDVRQGFTWQGRAADIAAASQRDRSAIALFRINPLTGDVSAVGEIPTTLPSVYGLCMYKGKGDQIYVFINGEDGGYEQYHITDTATGWQGEKVRSFSVPSQPEGCAADDHTHRLFFGEEAQGIWTFGAEPDDPEAPSLIASVGDVLVADVEGMDLYYGINRTYLVVSSQGNDSYVMMDATAPYQIRGRFRIGMNAEIGVDGASETDGLAVSAVAFSEAYPEGLLVVQDGRNFMPDAFQNFKYVDWRNIRRALGL